MSSDSFPGKHRWSSFQDLLSFEHGSQRHYEGSQDVIPCPPRHIATLVRSDTLSERRSFREGWLPAGEEAVRTEVYREGHGGTGENGLPEVHVRQQSLLRREMLQLVYHPQRYCPTFVPATVGPSLTFDQVARLLSQSQRSTAMEQGEPVRPSLTFRQVEQILNQGDTTSKDVDHVPKDANSSGQPLCKLHYQGWSEEHTVKSASSDIGAPQDEISPSIDQCPKKDGEPSHDQCFDQSQSLVVDEESQVGKTVEEDGVLSIKKNVTDDLKELQKALSPLSLSARRTSIASRLNSGMILRVTVEAEQAPAVQSPGYRRRAATMAFHSRPIPESNDITDTEDTVSVHSSVLSGTRTPSDSGSLVNFRSRLNSLLGRDSPHHLAAVYSINKPLRRNTISFAYTVR